MMNTMRTFASSFVAKLLLIFVVITFGIWGVGDILRNSGTNYAARVGSETISVTDFQRQKTSFTHQIAAMGIKDMNAAAMNVTLLRQLVQQKLILLTMHDLGLYVNDTLLMQAVRHQPAFLNPDGSFSSAAFHATLQTQRMSEAALLQEIRNETSGKFLLASLDMSDVTPPAPVRGLFNATALETRDALLITIAPATPATIDDKALHDFYEKNKSVLYVQPESRTLEYVILKQAQLEVLVDKSVTEQMLSDAQKAQPNTSKTALKTMLRSEQHDQVIHTLQGTIDDALAGGGTLSAALSNAGLSASTQTLADVTETSAKAATDDVTRTIATQGFQMGEGETSGLVITPKGTSVIVYVKSVHGSAPIDYAKVQEDVRAHVAEQLRRENARTRVQEVKAALNALTAEGKTQPTDQQWQAVLTKYKLSANHINNLARPSTDNKTGTNGIPPSLQQAIFEHPIGSLAGPLTLDNGSQMLAIVTHVHHPAPAMDTKSALPAKTLKYMATDLNQTVQSKAFTAFAERHPVKVNPAVLTPAHGPAATDDDAQ